MKVCVVGGTGNISSSIVRLLVQVGHDVTVFNRGKSSSAAPEGVTTIYGDRREDRSAFEAAMQNGRFDAAIDMICFNAEDAQSTLRAFRGVKHLIYCSTVTTYGEELDWLPATEDHPLRPTTDYGRNKMAADQVFLTAYYKEGFPVSIIKPAYTSSPKWPILRQIGGSSAWLDRIRKGKPIIVYGDGRTLGQWIHSDDAAPAFVFMLGRERCVGQTYNMMKREFFTWGSYHQTLMKIIGREVEMVGIPYDTLAAANVPGLNIPFSHNLFFSSEKLMRDVPEFHPLISLEEGMAEIYTVMEKEKKIADSGKEEWEDCLIAAQKEVGKLIVNN